MCNFITKKYLNSSQPWVYCFDCEMSYPLEKNISGNYKKLKFQFCPKNDKESEYDNVIKRTNRQKKLANIEDDIIWYPNPIGL